MTAIRRAVSWTVLPLALVASFGTFACTNIARQADGSFLASMGEQRVVIPASLAAGVADAVSEHGNDPQGLESAVRVIVAENAGGTGDTTLAIAIAEFAICSSGGDSDIVTAIVDGTIQGNPSVTPEMALGAVAAASSGALGQGSQDTRGTVESIAQGTAEDPGADVSPVQP